MSTPRVGTAFQSPKINVLVSFPYWEKNASSMKRVFDDHDPAMFRLLIDSGAFSAWTLGEEISLDSYMRFIRSLPSTWDVSCIQLDVVGDPVKTKENWLRMLDAGIDALPVFTRGGSFEVLDEYYAQSPLVMFGGIVQGKGNKNYIRHFMENNRGRPVHWLGFSDHNFMKHYRPFSVDSSTVTSAQRFGDFMYYAGAGKVKKLEKQHFVTEPPREFIQSCLRVGLTRKEIALLGQAKHWRGGADPTSWDTGKGIASLMVHIHQVYRGMDMERAIGTRYYIAQTTTATVGALFTSSEFLQERGRLV